MAFPVCSLFTHGYCEEEEKKKKKILNCVIVYIVLAGLQTHWLSVSLMVYRVESRLGHTSAHPLSQNGGPVYYCLVPRVTP